MRLKQSINALVLKDIDELRKVGKPSSCVVLLFITMSILKDGNLKVKDHTLEGCKNVLAKQPRAIIADLSGFDKDNIP